MKTLTELFHIQAIATQESIDNKNITPEHTFNTWFFDYSGHPIGWSKTADDKEAGIKPIEMSVYVEESGIQLMYWFIYNNLTESSKAKLS